ncbi:hypothetical protein ON010_g13277 [Phytophthora cinnamomi]|nr:hypothetical protein ON010_g13277 [Phytophthora cinnamomi]
MPYLAEDEKSEKLTIELDGDIDELLLVEEEILAEDDEVQTAFQPENVKTALVEFHIVYHTIYQTPVLYFRALAVDGTPLPASVVTRDVQFPGSDGRSTFVAMEEHPVLGKPYSFLHPCETAAAMQLLQAQVRPSSSDINTPSEVKLPQYLASWLSLVQPLTGISPLDYYATMTLEENAARPRKNLQRRARVQAAAWRRLVASSSDDGKHSRQRQGQAPARHNTSASRAGRACADQRQEAEAVGVAGLGRRAVEAEPLGPTADSEDGFASARQPSARPDEGVEPAEWRSPAHDFTVEPSDQTQEAEVGRTARIGCRLGFVVRDYFVAATEPVFWIKRREVVDAALKELDALEYVEFIQALRDARC